MTAPGARTVFSVCPHDCPSVCALDVELDENDRVQRIRGARQPYTDGLICSKVARYGERIHHPERLSAPLRRIGPKGEGKFAPISWDEALDELAENFKKAAARYGAETVWLYDYAGTMGLVQRGGLKRLRHVMGYSRMGETICSSIANTGWIAGAGVRRGAESNEMALSDLIVVWGGNLVHTQVQAMKWINKARRDHDAKLVVIDPYLTPTAKQADLHLAPRPGTDAALACAVMHVLFAEGLADRDYLARYTDFPLALEEHLAQRGPDWAERICGVPADKIIAFARLYGATKKSFIRIGFGFSRHRNGAAAMHAVTCLPAVSGAWAHQGGGALFGQSILNAGLDTSLIDAKNLADKRVRTLDMSRIGAVLTNDPRDLGDGPPVTAMLIQNTNPIVVAPESAKVRQGFLRDDLFVCVHEQFMTETALMADLVLPATMFLEHDDIYIASAHNYLQVARAVLRPFAQCRPNHQVVSALAERLGAQHPAFAMTEWRIIDDVLKGAGKPGADEILAARWLDCSPGFEESHFLNGFGHPDGRFRFAPDWEALGDKNGLMPTLPDHLDLGNWATADKPFRLVAAPARHFLNSSFTETPSSRRAERRPTALVHPASCARLGLAEGDLARLGNENGSILIHVRPAEGMQPDTVVVESVWPNHAFIEGQGINVLVSAEPALPAGGAAFHDTAVWLHPA